MANPADGSRDPGRALYVSIPVARLPSTSKTAPSKRSGLQRISSFLAAFRWAYMPLGLLALIAVGVHAAADTVDDRLLAVIEAADAFFDSIWARTESLSHWVNVVEPHECTMLARGITLAWELCVDLAIGLPMLGYREVEAREAKLRGGWKETLKRLNLQPTPMRLLRPIITGIFSLAGAYAIARMCEGALFVSIKAGALPEGMAFPVARTFAAAAFLLISAAFGGRAVLRALQHADSQQAPVTVKAADQIAFITGSAKPPKLKSRFTVGLLGTALALPLAVAALIDALPLLAFFR